VPGLTIDLVEGRHPATAARTNTYRRSILAYPVDPGRCGPFGQSKRLRTRVRGIAQLAARWAAAFVLDPAGVTRTKALGTEQMERKGLDRDAFSLDGGAETTVDLEGHRATPLFWGRVGDPARALRGSPQTTRTPSIMLHSS
jgi:hypothetical protein